MGSDRSEAGSLDADAQEIAQRATLHFVDWREVLDLATQLVRTRALFVPGEMTCGTGFRVEVTLHLPDGMTLCLTGVSSAVATATLSGTTVGVDEKHAMDLILLEELARAAQK